MFGESKKPAAPLMLVIAAFAAVYTIWGSTYLAIMFAIQTIPPFLMNGIRFLVAGLILLAYMRRRDRTPLTFANWKAAATVGVVLLCGGPGLVAWSEQYVPSGLTSLIIATVPLWLVVLDWLLYRGSRPSGAVVAGLVGGLLGVYLLIGPANISGKPVHPIGGAVLLLACLLWSLGSLHSRRANLPKSPFLATAMEMIAAGVVLLLMGTLAGEWSKVDVGAVTLKSMLSVAYLGFFGSIVGLTAYTWLLRVTTASRVATYAYVNPVVALALGAWLAGETLSPRTIVAASIILASVVVITLAKTRGRCEAPGESASEVVRQEADGPAPAIQPDASIAKQDLTKAVCSQ